MVLNSAALSGVPSMVERAAPQAKSCSFSADGTDVLATAVTVLDASH